MMGEKDTTEKEIEDNDNKLKNTQKKDINKKVIETKETDTKNKTSQKDEIPKKDFTKTIVITIFIILILGTGWIMFTSYNNSFAKEQCLAIQNHPDLNYDCSCYPSEKPTDLDPFIDANTEKHCRCDCDLGNNETYTAWIIRANK
ncbi:MAG: hypothetical protein K0B07_00370 [DPANN group archaeon]|nr:hypothetical protein [DPANN group archaeon]